MICPPCSAAAAANPGKPHEACTQRCMCQHGRPYEASPDHLEGFPGYLDSVPDDHPARKRFEEETGRKLPPRAGSQTAL